MSFWGLSLTKNLKAEQAEKAALEGEKAALEVERARLDADLTEARGVRRFKIARLIIDLDYLEPHLRNIVYNSLWIEVESLGRKVVLIAYADKVLGENEQNAIVAHFPRAERL